MPRDRFCEIVIDAILALPQDLKVVLRIVEDAEVDDESRVALAGALLHVLSAGNSIPGARGILQRVGDVLLLRLVLERIEVESKEAFARHREESADMLGPLEDELATSRAYLGDGIRVLEQVAGRMAKVSHQGHSARACALETEENNWLYDAVHEAMIEALEFEEDEVEREMRKVDTVRDALMTRAQSLTS
ncbi:MAG: hypothetical protein GXP55_25130 [Deltaproteobacteria bacterium]|nr:hypothetical protein [Deltaproteobacteria bacterium]